jgi:GT2 family glycosyltransferase
VSTSVISGASLPAAQASSTHVAIIVVTHNGRQHIAPCLRSLKASQRAGHSLLVVDNNSADGTCDLLAGEFPAVPLLSLAANVGYGEAVNLAARQTDADYLVVLNQDVVAAPGWLEPLVEALEADPGAALATPKIVLRSDPSRVNACGNLPHYTGITTCRGFNRPAAEFRQPEPVPAVSGAAFVIRRAVFEQLGGFDPRFFLYLEDTDLSLRALQAGYRCLLVPRAEVCHDFEPRFSPDKLGYLERNRHQMLLKLYCWRTLLRLAPALLLTELAVLGYSLLRGPRCLAAKLVAYVWLARHWGQIMVARRQTQANRRLGDAALLSQLARNLALDELQHPLGQAAMAALNPLFRLWFGLAGARSAA